MQIVLDTQMTENRRSNEQTNKYYLLKKRGSVKVFVDFPHENNPEGKNEN